MISVLFHHCEFRNIFLIHDLTHYITDIQCVHTKYKVRIIFSKMYNTYPYRLY